MQAENYRCNCTLAHRCRVIDGPPRNPLNVDDDADSVQIGVSLHCINLT